MHPYSIATWGTLLIFLIFLFTKNADTFIYTWYIMIFTIGGMIGLNGSSLNFTHNELKRNTHYHGIFGITLAVISLILDFYNLEIVSLILNMYIGLAIGYIIRNYSIKKHLNQYKLE